MQRRLEGNSLYWTVDKISVLGHKRQHGKGVTPSSPHQKYSSITTNTLPIATSSTHKIKDSQRMSFCFSRSQIASSPHTCTPRRPEIRSEDNMPKQNPTDLQPPQHDHNAVCDSFSSPHCAQDHPGHHCTRPPQSKDAFSAHDELQTEKRRHIAPRDA